jgi:hypothetical protein
MKYFITYNNTTGQILQTTVTTSEENIILDGTQLSLLEVPEPIDNEKYYLDPQSLQTIAFPEKTDKNYTWDWSTKTWQDLRTQEQKYTEADKLIKQQRKQALMNSDWVVIKALEQGVPIPEAWSIYRQQLRDITQQSNYPFTVTWPTPPNQ